MRHILTGTVCNSVEQITAMYNYIKPRILSEGGNVSDIPEIIEIPINRFALLGTGFSERISAICFDEVRELSKNMKT